MQTRYDPRTAVTFLLAGVGLGALFALIFAPRDPNVPLPTGRRAGDRPTDNRRTDGQTTGPSLTRAV
ncbi:MAG TPA: hypothetical protein VLL05_02615 [Terriglobales bacterium]|nr:hypothetical protein [Terriglobales bacterium]